MVTLFRTPVRWIVATMAVPALLTLGCDETATVGIDDAPAGASRSYDAWTPGANDTCTPEVHNRYAVVGPDGKLYPTWHPPVDQGTGCTFGHEHGRDPGGSDLFSSVGPIPFGFANEVADLFAPHVGYKVEWANDVEMSFGNVGNGIFRTTCDVLVELHQGSAGGGAFVNPLHELAYHARCESGEELHLTFITTIGHGGSFTRSCDGDVEVVLDPTSEIDGGGRRRIPDRTCVERHILVAEGQNSSFGSGLRESWQFSESIRAEGGRRLASIGPYFNVINPSRYYDPDAPDGIGRPIDLCYEVTEAGLAARGGLCEESTAGGTITGITWDDPRSAFDGARRDVDINQIRISNADGPEIWYTDAFGEQGRPEPFPGSIRQFIAKIDNDGLAPSGPSIGRDRQYGGDGVHPPN